MDPWLDFARGPLFALTFLIMLLGLARHVLLQIQVLATKGRAVRRTVWRRILADSLGWVFPLKHFSPGTRFLTTASILFHIGAILTPLFLADHVVLWGSFLGVRLPRLSAAVADLLALSTMVLILVLLLYRVAVTRSRELSKANDHLVLLLVLLPFLTGYLASHPAVNPLSWDVMMLLHILSGEALFVAIPFTKLAHVVLFPFNRMSQLHWQLRTGAGQKVAVAVYGEEARV